MLVWQKEFGNMLGQLHAKSGGDKNSGSMEGWGSTYDKITAILFLGKEREVRQNTLELAHLNPGEHVLEVGCGTGTLTLVAKEKVGQAGEVYGIDVAGDMLNTAWDKAMRANVEATFQSGRIEEIPFPDHRFDVVLCSLMLHHVPGDEAKRKGFIEIQRVLKPGGRLLIVDFEPPTNLILQHFILSFLGQAMLKNNVREFIPMMEKTGFVDIESGRTNSRFISFVRGKRPL
jgi:ubiquinone/menaquinone biosynthesis C-methylase UbiE